MTLPLLCGRWYLGDWEVKEAFSQGRLIKTHSFFLILEKCSYENPLEICYCHYRLHIDTQIIRGIQEFGDVIWMRMSSLPWRLIYLNPWFRKMLNCLGRVRMWGLIGWDISHAQTTQSLSVFLFLSLSLFLLLVDVKFSNIALVLCLTASHHDDHGLTL